MGSATTQDVSRVRLLRFEDMEIDGEPLMVFGDRSVNGDAGGDSSRGGSGGSGQPTRAAPGTDLAALDRLGMQIAVLYELRRLRREGADAAVAVVAPSDPVDSADLVVDVSTPEAIARAEHASPVARTVLADLERRGLSLLYPGFDLLTIRNAKAQRLIELKSSGVDARVQTMTWNEWKSAVETICGSCSGSTSLATSVRICLGLRTCEPSTIHSGASILRQRASSTCAEPFNCVFASSTWPRNSQSACSTPTPQNRSDRLPL